MQDHVQLLVRRMKWKVTLGWLAVSMLPLVILLVFIATMLGPRYGVPIPTGAFFDQVVWQLDTWNEEESAFRALNTALLEDPESLFEGPAPERLETVENHLILIRRGDAVRPLNALGEEETARLSERINTVEGQVLPAYGEVEKTHNRALFEATGYIVSRQLDFRYEDGTRGSAYLLTRVVNIPAKVAAFVMRYFLTAFLLILGILLVVTFRFTRSFSRRLERMMETTQRVAEGDFTVRLEVEGEGPFDALAEELNEMIEGLAEAKVFRETTESNRMTFISHLTHDLKTPLSGISMHMEALHDGIITTPEARRQSRADVRRKIGEMNAMLAELSLYNELESVKAQYQKIPVEVEAFVRDILQEWRFEERDIDMVIRTEAAESAMIQVDPGKMRRVLINLLENCVKHVRRRPLTIHVTAKTTADCVQLILWDDGPGVPEETVPLLFERYYRVDPARNQDQPGSGLGLSICRKIVQDHDGQIVADLHPEGGLRMTLSLPRIEEGDRTDETIIDHRG